MWQLTNSESLNVVLENAESFSRRYFKHFLYLHKAITNCFVIPSFKWSGGKNTSFKWTRLQKQIVQIPEKPLRDWRKRFHTQFTKFLNITIPCLFFVLIHILGNWATTYNFVYYKFPYFCQAFFAR